MGKHYPCMSMIFVSDLLDSPGKIELEATAVFRSGRRAQPQRLVLVLRFREVAGFEQPRHG